MMETLCKRLSACQDAILELYERDSIHLSDHIDHWKHVRLENVLLYKAREMGLQSVNQQAVPSLAVSRSKGHNAIELQIALESLNESSYNTEDWTLQHTSWEQWVTDPKQCFKKGGKTVEVRYDCDKDNTMQYVVWTFVYYWLEGQWYKVNSHVDYNGIYYETQDNEKVYYTHFSSDAKRYGVKGIWDVCMGGEVICSAPVSSTCEVSTPEIVRPLHTSNSSNAQDAGVPARKRHRQCDPDEGPLDFVHNLQSTTDSSTQCTLHNVAPIVHLKGDKNSLKCLRYRMHKGYSHLFNNVTTTWHWTNNTNSKCGVITFMFSSTSQQKQFLQCAKIPPTISVSSGYMSL
uniref:Regulatory protein E2 n=1 Tax=Human papillomavirus type 34 TaxID=333764 RepID=A0A0P0ERQ4_HPV34|nr:early protein E2 [Human papillomavirus type 34]ALJ32481.1 early protein E2 [Human papillomavirus type 34]ALJ32488.1 early protein E2 [Human papillomavirus type 34]ALJ32495.1 early protein E2 [Human papillomavirus type 34]